MAKLILRHLLSTAEITLLR